MREILFRGKCIQGKEWVYGYFFAKPILEKYFIELGNEMWQVDPTTVGQYTGLQDMNGDKIFEGDILQDTGCCDYVFAVVYRKSLNDDEDPIWKENVGFYCDWIKFPSCIEPNCGLAFCANKSKIIGNIHNNPELLKVE